jgi:hypothetical protein
MGCLVIGSAWGALSDAAGWLLASRVVVRKILRLKVNSTY